VHEEWNRNKSPGIEEDGYPLFEVSAEKLPFSSEAKIITTPDKSKAYKYFEEACKDNAHS